MGRSKKISPKDFVKNEMSKKILKMTRDPYEENRQLARVIVPSMPKANDDTILKKIKDYARQIMPITNIGARLGISRQIWFQNLKLNNKVFCEILNSEMDEYSRRQKKYDDVYDAYIYDEPLVLENQKLINVNIQKFNAAKEAWAMFQVRFDRYSTSGRIVKIEEGKTENNFLNELIEIEEKRNSSIFQKIRYRIVERLDKEAQIKKRSDNDLTFRHAHLRIVNQKIKEQIQNEK